MKKTLALSLLLVTLAACSQDASESQTAADNTAQKPAAAADPEPSIYAAAVASTTRPADDRDSDATRKPDAVLEFFGIEPGDVVLEMWAGRGYYTEILAHVVGDNGKVIAHQNTPTINFAGDAHPQRHADNRLPNADILIAENNELSIEPGTLDAATIILNYHDLFWTSEQYGWDAIDVPTFLAELYNGIKPGGVLGIVDHRAIPGAPAETGNSLHRIDPAIVIADLQDAGFVLEAESDILVNPDDDPTKNVFDPSVRGKTDRFVLRFRKPE
jgi:predicted methyltransferase